MFVSMAVVGFREFRGLGYHFALPPGICAREAGRQQKCKSSCLLDKWVIS
jgi:hypothetical protein